ncbi:MAG: MFS transporter [Thermoproteota archaeon]
MIVLFEYAPWFASSLGAGYLQVGLVSTAYCITNILGSYLWGGLSDVWRNRKLLPVLSGISYPACLFFLSIVDSPVQIILVRGVMGFIFPAYISPVLALMSREVGVEGRGARLGGFNSTRSLGSTLGLFLAGYMITFLELNSAFQLLAVLTVLSVPPLLLVPGELTEICMPSFSKLFSEIRKNIFPSGEGEHVLRSKGLIYMYITLSLRVICIVGFASFLSPYIIGELGYSPEFLGYFSGYGQALIIVGMFIAGWAADKLGRKTVVNIGLLLSGLTPILYSLSGWLVTLMVARTLHSMGYCLVMNGISTFVGDVTSEENRGAFMGLIYVFYGIGDIIGPVIMGSLLGYLGYFPMGVIMALFSLSGLVMGV